MWETKCIIKLRGKFNWYRVDNLGERVRFNIVRVKLDPPLGASMLRKIGG